MAPIITLKNVSYAYPRSKTAALNNLSLEIEEGEFLAVMGENGAGKTTFCRLLNGLIPHSEGGTLSGTVLVDGMDTVRAAPSSLAALVGMVLDDPEIQLFTGSVRAEAAFGPENLLVSPAEVAERVTWALKTTGLWECRDAAPSALSGGQRQRLALAAALAQAGKILVLDEPVTRLDPAGAAAFFSALGALRERTRLTVIMATHNSEEAARFAGRICVLKDGAAAACDAPCEIFGGGFSGQWGIALPAPPTLAAYLRKKGEAPPLFPPDFTRAAAAVTGWLYGNKADAAG